ARAAAGLSDAASLGFRIGAVYRMNNPLPPEKYVFKYTLVSANDPETIAFLVIHPTMGPRLSVMTTFSDGTSVCTQKGGLPRFLVRPKSSILVEIDESNLSGFLTHHREEVKKQIILGRRPLSLTPQAEALLTEKTSDALYEENARAGI